MKNEFLTYLNEVGYPEDHFNRIEEIHDFYDKNFDFTIDDIFISEYIDNDGQRQFQNLWFFAEDMVMEAKNFLIEDKFDLCSIGRIRTWQIEKKEYDFVNYNSNSRITLDISFEFGLIANFSAIGKNCDYLKNIFLKYFSNRCRQK